MMAAKEARVTQWGTSLGIRLPKEFTDGFDIRHKSIVQVNIQDGMLQVIPINKPRVRKPLAAILEAARENGTWDGTPGDVTAEDREWLDSPSVGAEVVTYE